MRRLVIFVLVIFIDCFFLTPDIQAQMESSNFKIEGNFDFLTGKPSSANYKLTIEGQLMPSDIYKGQNYIIRTVLLFSEAPFIFALSPTVLDFENNGQEEVSLTVSTPSGFQILGQGENLSYGVAEDQTKPFPSSPTLLLMGQKSKSAKIFLRNEGTAGSLKIWALPTY